MNKKSKEQNNKGNSISIEKKKEYKHIIETARHTSEEITDGLKILKEIKKDVVSIFGSHVTKESSKDYINCEKAAYLLGKKGYAVITGGGPGIMKAANAGAMRAKTVSVGFKAELIQKEQHVDSSLFTHQYSFHFLFVRRFCLAVESKALIFYPGGYGTLNEMFEYITLIETRMEEPIPVICVNRKYWKGMFDWLQKNAVKEDYIKESHLKKIFVVDTPEEILKIIKNSEKR